MNSGCKIKELRKKSGISQLDLEMMLDMAVGSLSRIENGKVNPSKETLIKIAKFFELDSYQTIALFDIVVPSIEIDEELLDEQDLITFAQKSVDLITKQLYGSTSVLFLLADEGKSIYSHSISDNWKVRKLLKIFPGRFRDYKADLINYDQSFVVQTLKGRKIHLGSLLSDFVSPTLPRKLSDISQKILGIRSVISLPLEYKHKICGVILVVSTKDRFTYFERSFLMAYCQKIALLLSRRQDVVSIEFEGDTKLERSMSEYQLAHAALIRSMTS